MTEVKGKQFGNYGQVPDLNVVTQIWGFDPMELLASVEFPNDRYERLLRRSKEARMLAIRRQDITLPTSDSLQASAANLAPARSELFLTTSSMLNVNLDATNGLRASSAAHRLHTANVTNQNTRKEDIALREQLARSAAAILVQCLFRGWTVRRKYVAVVYFNLTKQSVSSNESKILAGLPDLDDLSVQERLLRKFKNFCKFFERADKLLPDFPYFCAAYIQSTFRMFIVRRSWLRLRSMTMENRHGSAAHEARQEMNRLVERADFKAGTWTDAAKKIQRAWRSYYSVKIYRFYRELIKFREKGDHESSQLIDGATGIHVRFRLGGTKFPPTIYYKIFVHSRLVDMNAFSPRDYTKEVKQAQPKVLFTKKYELPPARTDADGWYKRNENNGWRPVSDRVWDERNDEVTISTSEKSVAYHYSKIKRRQNIERKRKEKKLKWLKAMYEQGRHGKWHHEISDQNTDTEGDEKPQTEEDLLLAINELEKDIDHDIMRKWVCALDFEDYVNNWMSISMTGKSDDPATFDIDDDGESDNGQGLSKKLRHARDFSTFEGELMAEIDLFRRIADETQSQSVDREDNASHLDMALGTVAAAGSEFGGSSVGGGVGGSAGKKKERPWSGRSARSVQDVFLSKQDDEEF
ncbi:hypothetical protein BC829DRAFT_382734 [Chytridium lagenaria]|nr:hypothetical protein BC829DRAFT_382734 [Chytridium lagenaria]